nr:MAG TPA: hypothetical protein [Caudoviricetes sp.]
MSWIRLLILLVRPYIKILIKGSTLVRYIKDSIERG